MNKKNIETSKDTMNSFLNHKSYSIDEIMAAGGPDAFAEKLGKDFKNIENRLKDLPKDAFLTEEEVAQALKTLQETK